MAKKAACPQCGAKNDLDARRCRICANLLNADIPEQPHRPKGLPDSVQRQIEAELGLSGEIPPPSFAAAPPPPPPTPAHGGFAPPPPPAHGGFAPPPPPPPAGAPLPPPPAGAAPPPPPLFGGGDPYATPEPPAPPLYEVADEEPFDPDALFRDMGRSHLPPPPPPPPVPDELRLPPPQAPGPDPLWSVGADLGNDPTSEEIERATREALREERLKKRPGFLDRVFKGDEDDEGQQQQQ